MDTPTFIVEVLKATAWPISFVVVGFSFRSEIRSLLGKLKKGKVGPAEFEFEQAVAAIANDAPRDDGTKEKSLSVAAIQLAASEPRLAILNAWLEVQSEVERLVDIELKNGVRPKSGSVSLHVLHRVLKDKLEYLDMYNDLKLLRNQAVHEVGFSPRAESVTKYIELSKQLVNVLKSLQPAT